MFKTITMAAALAATLLTTTPVTAKEDVCAELAELARTRWTLQRE